MADRLRALQKLTKRQVRAADSTGERNTLIFLERWSVKNEVSDADVLHGQTEV